MTGTPDDRFEDHDLDRLLAQMPPPPPMRAGLIDDIVSEAQRVDRVSASSPSWKPRPSRRAWTRRGVWTGVIALNLIFASAVAAAFGGGVLSVARIRAVAATIVEHIHHPHRHAIAVPHHAPGAGAPVHAPPRIVRSIAAPVPTRPVATMRAMPAASFAPVARPGFERARNAMANHAVHPPALRQDHRAGERPRASVRDIGPRNAGRGGMHRFGGEGRGAGIAAAPARRADALAPGNRPNASMERGWQRPGGPMDGGFGRARPFGGGWRQGPWGRGPGFRARRFGPGGGVGPGPRRRFGPMGGRGRGRPIRRRF